jgi:hypothetical protein
MKVTKGAYSFNKSFTFRRNAPKKCKGRVESTSNEIEARKNLARDHPVPVPSP